MNLRKKSKFDNPFIGLILGLLIPVAALYFLYLYKHSADTFQLYINYLKAHSILTKIVSLCTLPDLGIFYIFLNKQYYKSVKGVITAVFFIVFWVLYVKFF